MTEFLISLPNVARRLDVDQPTLLRWLRDGDIPPPVLAGGYARMDADLLGKWRASSCPKGEQIAPSVLAQVRLALMREEDDIFDASVQKLSDMLYATTDLTVLAKVDAILNS